MRRRMISSLVVVEAEIAWLTEEGTRPAPLLAERCEATIEEVIEGVTLDVASSGC